MDITSLGNQVMEGIPVTKKEAVWLYGQPVDKLCSQADKIRKAFCSDTFKLCTAICDRYMDGNLWIASNQKKLEERAKISYAQGLSNSSVGIGIESSEIEAFEQICQGVYQMREKIPINVCVHAGILDENQYKKIKKARVRRSYHDLQNIWHTLIQEKSTVYMNWLESVRSAEREGIPLCVGVSPGLEKEWKEHINMAFLFRKLKIRDVVFHIPFEASENPGTFLKRLKRNIALYRFILPYANICLGTGRGILEDKGYSCFCAGVNGALTGDMLATAGITVEMDRERIEKMGYII